MRRATCESGKTPMSAEEARKTAEMLNRSNERLADRSSPTLLHAEECKLCGQCHVVHTKPETVWAQSDASDAEMARRQRVLDAMSRKPKARKFGR